MRLKEEVEKLFGQNTEIIEGLNNELYLPLNEEALQNAMKIFSENNFELISLFCV